MEWGSGQDRKALAPRRSGAAIVEADEPERVRPLFGTDKRRRELQGIGGAQGVGPK
jgi:hypothetical protein